jgi:hypothetical protein
MYSVREDYTNTVYSLITSLQYCINHKNRVKAYIGLHAGADYIVNKTVSTPSDLNREQKHSWKEGSANLLNCGINQYTTVKLNKRLSANSLISYSISPFDFYLPATYINSRLSWQLGLSCQL